MCLDGRTCFIVNSVLYYNIVLHCEVAEDADMAELADRAIRLIISMTINFIIISPLPRVHFCLGKVWRNPNMKLSCCTLNIGRVEVEQNGEAVPTSGGRPRSGLDPLVRIKEHLDGRNRSAPGTPLGAHRRQSHNNLSFEVKATILSYERDTIARKTLEAFWIMARNPKINRKDECLAITNELAAFQGLCRF